MSKKLIRCIVGVLILVMLISNTACTSTPATSTPDATTAAPTTTEATTAASTTTTPETTSEQTTATPVATPEPEITLNMFTYSNYAFEGAVPEEITKKTGVKLNMWDSSNRDDKYPLMLASGDLPDIIVMFQGTDILNNYIESKAIIPLNDLIQEYGPNIQKYYGQYLKRAVYTDKVNYYIPTECGLTSDPGGAMLMRMDLLEEFAGQRALDGDSFTTDEYKTFLQQFKQKYTEINGAKTIGMSVFAQDLVGQFEGFWGIMPYYQTGGTGKVLMYKWRDPKYIEMLLYLNDLKREGLIDVDWPTMKPDTWYAAMAKGNYFSGPAGWWEAEFPNSTLRQEYGQDTKTQYMAYQLTAPGLTKADVTTDQRIGQGALAVAITKLNKYPERTMKFLNYLGSEEGHYLAFWGIEGFTYDIVDGKWVPKQNVIDDYMTDWKPAAKKWTIRTWCFMWYLDMMKDNIPLDMVFVANPTAAAKFAKHSTGPKVDISLFNGLQPTSTQPEMINHQKVTDIVSVALSQIVNAPSADEAKALYDRMVKDCNDAGAAQVENVINVNAAARRELWGIN